MRCRSSRTCKDYNGQIFRYLWQNCVLRLATAAMPGPLAGPLGMPFKMPSIPSMTSQQETVCEFESGTPIGIGWKGTEVGQLKDGGPAELKGVKIGWSAVALNGVPLEGGKTDDGRPITKAVQFSLDLEEAKASTKPFRITFRESAAWIQANRASSALSWLRDASSGTTMKGLGLAKAGASGLYAGANELYQGGAKDYFSGLASELYELSGAPTKPTEPAAAPSMVAEAAAAPPPPEVADSAAASEDKPQEDPSPARRKKSRAGPVIKPAAPAEAVPDAPAQAEAAEGAGGDQASEEAERKKTRHKKKKSLTDAPPI